MSEPKNREKEIFNEALEMDSPEARAAYVRVSVQKKSHPIALRSIDPPAVRCEDGRCVKKGLKNPLNAAATKVPARETRLSLQVIEAAAM